MVLCIVSHLKDDRIHELMCHMIYVLNMYTLYTSINTYIYIYHLDLRDLHPLGTPLQRSLAVSSKKPMRRSSAPWKLISILGRASWKKETFSKEANDLALQAHFSTYTAYT